MPTDIAIAVVEHNGRLLIGQRPPNVALAGLWEFPGGKVEPGESPAEAAVRECAEEAGLAIEVLSEYPTHTHAYPHDKVRLHFFRCRVIGDEAQPRAPFMWVERKRLGDYEFPRGNDKLLMLLADDAAGNCSH
jgi:mutator protein MutT